VFRAEGRQDLEEQEAEAHRERARGKDALRRRLCAEKTLTGFGREHREEREGKRGEEREGAKEKRSRALAARLTAAPPLEGFLMVYATPCCAALEAMQWRRSPLAGAKMAKGLVGSACGIAFPFLWPGFRHTMSYRCRW